MCPATVGRPAPRYRELFLTWGVANPTDSCTLVGLVARGRRSAGLRKEHHFAGLATNHNTPQPLVPGAQNIALALDEVGADVMADSVRVSLPPASWPTTAATRSSPIPISANIVATVRR